MSNSLPLSLKKISLFLERLPGIGEKTANRLAFHFLKLPSEDLQDFAKNISNLHRKTKLCPICRNLTEEKLCYVCSDNQRDKKIITVVEDVLDIVAFETGNIYQGVYHVLHGRIDPLNRMTAEDIKIGELLQRIKDNPDIEEVVLATNPDMEGEATAMFIKAELEKVRRELGKTFVISRLGYGLPMGANLEYADYMTLKKSLENRNKL